MKSISVVTAAMLGVACLAAPSISLAQTNADKGAMMLQMWDVNSDGSVTLAEVQTRRGDMFTAFDANGDDVLTADEMAMMDEMRALQQEEMGGGMGEGHGQGMGHGQGKGQGEGHGQGKGQGQGMGKGMGAMGQSLDRASFVAKAKDWLARKDTNGDGVLTADDFSG